MVLEEKSFFELDWNRVASFFVLGVTYVGAFQYRLYNHWLKPLNDVWRPKYGLALSTGAVVAIDQAFVQPFLYLPTFLGIRVVSEGGTRLLDLPSEIFAKWKQTGPETMTALWLVWVPAQAINFAVIPFVAFGLGKIFFADQPWYALGLLLAGRRRGPGRRPAGRGTRQAACHAM